MNQITFFYTVPLSDLFAALILLALGVYSFKHTRGRIFPLIGGIIICTVCSFMIIDYLIHNLPPKKILIALTETDVVFPGEKRDEKILIPWNKILLIHREDYSMGYRHKTYHEKLKLYYCIGANEKPQITSIDLHYLAESDFTFFSQVRKFYTGRILKEFNREQFKILADIAKDHLIWEDYTQTSSDTLQNINPSS